MIRIAYQNQTFECAPQETVLDALARQGVILPSGCRAGACQSCLMKVRSGIVPAQSQQGLKPTQVAQGYFLACSCKPTQDLEITTPDQADTRRIRALVRSLEPLNADITAVHLEPEQVLEYRAGQFIRLFKDDRQSRCYSLASVPTLDSNLEIHVRHVLGGLVSGWVHRDLQVGTPVEIGASSGQCFYLPERPQQPLLLLGTGSGLAPLYGIVRDALHQGHQGPIRLYHGSLDRAGLYREQTLRELAGRHPQFSYAACVSQEPDSAVRFGSVLEVAMADQPDLSGWRVFLCGNPDMIRNARMQTFLAGAAMAEIHADPFLPSGGAPSPTP